MQGLDQLVAAFRRDKQTVGLLAHTAPAALVVKPQKVNAFLQPAVANYAVDWLVHPRIARFLIWQH